MSSDSENKKRIAKNTLFLYGRMLLLLLINLYTSRVFLNALGVVDYGIYNVVGGIVAMVSLLSNSLSAAISRFITFDLGIGDIEKLKKTFSSSVTIQLLLGIIVIIAVESVGIWFLNNKAVIPEERLNAAHWVLQLSLATFVINLISVPYNAAIIAHEHFSAFAYISLIEGFGKLAIALSIAFAPFDRLVFYAFLMGLLAIVVRIVYGIYCRTHFAECKYHFIWDKACLKNMFAFSGWNFIGAASSIFRDQGGNILINIFYGPAVNAARAVSMQVNAAVGGFVSNFITALNPQITKSYASGNRGYMLDLVFQGARFSFYLLLVLSLPVLFNTHYLLVVWLKLVPEHAVTFVQLVLIFSLSESLSSPLITAMLATGNIRNYQIFVGGIVLLNLPISYVLLKLGFPVECILVVALVLSQASLVARLVLLKGMIGLPVKKYLKNVYLNVLLIAFVASVLPVAFTHFSTEGFKTFIISCFICLASSLAFIAFIGLSRNERIMCKEKVVKIIGKIRK